MTKPNTEGWEKGFDELWLDMTDELGLMQLNSKPFKLFISQEIARAKEETIEKIKSYAIDHCFLDSSETAALTVVHLEALVDYLDQLKSEGEK